MTKAEIVDRLCKILVSYREGIDTSSHRDTRISQLVMDVREDVEAESDPNFVPGFGRLDPEDKLHPISAILQAMPPGSQLILRRDMNPDV